MLNKTYQTFIKMSVCIVGAGISGLCAAKHVIQNGLKAVVFEQNDQVGGTWIYSDKIGLDEFGVEIHSSMYKNLRTNLPKEIMGFPDFPFPNQEKSYIPAEDVLEFIKLYAENFDLIKHIKFRNYILRIVPKNEKYEVIVKDLLNGELITYIFDFVLICNGHYQTPLMPKISGMEKFVGKQIHSHDYRQPDTFKGDKILIIGGGSSALDLILHLSGVAGKIIISHHLSKKINIPDSFIQKPDVLKMYENHIEFLDGTKEIVDTIIYCTGYRYSFPFLSMDCGIYVEDNFVQPLYKQCINIKLPTIAFIGLLTEAAIGHIIDMQVRFVMTYFTGKKQLPSKEEMYADTERIMKERLEFGLQVDRPHVLGCELQKIYFNDLSVTAGIENVDPVILKLYYVASCSLFLEKLLNFRNTNFKIIDRENFTKLTN